MATPHNTLRVPLEETCQSCSGIDTSNDLTSGHSHFNPADTLVSNWAAGMMAAHHISVTSLLYIIMFKPSYIQCYWHID